jgi:hypothetical protein
MIKQKTKLYFSGAFSVTLLTMAYRNAGVKHFLDVNMVELSKIGKCLLQKKFQLRITNYELPQCRSSLRTRGKGES